MSALQEAVANLGRAPCQSCPNQARCAEERIACLDFRYYVTHGEMPNLSDEDAEPRRPTKFVYDLIYSADDAEPISVH